MHAYISCRVTARAAAFRPGWRTHRKCNAGHHSRCPSSIREFISNECPSPGWDRVYREQPRDATVEAELLEFDRLWSPGCMVAGALPIEAFSSVSDDSGIIMITPAADRGKASSKGSYAAVCQVVAAQNIGSSVRIRMLVQQRVLLQAVASSATSQRARAAVLDDRWVYYTRAGALEEAASSTHPTPNPPIRPEVLTALTDCLEASEEVLALMRHMSELTQKLADGPESDGPSAELVAEAAEEWDRLLAWVENVDFGPPAPPSSSSPSSSLTASATPSSSSSSSSQEVSGTSLGSSDASGASSATSTPSQQTASASSSASSSGEGAAGSDFPGGRAERGSQLWRLKVAGRVSFAPFAAAATPVLLGWKEEEVEAGRALAMRTTDTGNRLEEAAEYLQKLKGKLSARLMLQQL